MDGLPDDFLVTSTQFTKKTYLDLYPALDISKPEFSQAGKVVIITGASRGLGRRGFAPQFAKAGAKGLVLTATNGEKLKALEAELNKAYPSVQTLAVVSDISDNASIQSLFEKIKATFGHADVLVNNAGVNAFTGDMLETPIDKWFRNFEVNVKGTFNMSQHFVRALPSPTTPATIISLLSSGAWETHPAVSGYSISKSAVMRMGQYWGEVYPNLSSVSLDPGLADTDMLLDMFRRFHQVTPELVGAIAVWLTLPKTKFLSGRMVRVHWDVDELLRREDEIVTGNLLKLGLTGKFGPDQFKD